jgi:hypothetical protein
MQTQSLFKRFEYAEPLSVIAAIVDVHDVMDAEGLKPGMERWHNDTRWHRPQMCDRVAQRWCEITSRDTHDFPFDHNFIAQVWVAFRKEGEANKESIRRDLLSAGLT